MATLSFGVLTPPRGNRSATFAGRVASAFNAVATEWRARRAARSVESLSDSMLHDIGITRGEIDQAVRFGRGRVR